MIVVYFLIVANLSVFFYTAQEITKRSIRVQTWKKFQEHRCAAPPIDVFNKIPNFKGAEAAAVLLADLDEFKKASKF